MTQHVHSETVQQTWTEFLALQLGVTAPRCLRAIKRCALTIKPDHFKQAPYGPTEKNNKKYPRELIGGEAAESATATASQQKIDFQTNQNPELNSPVSWSCLTSRRKKGLKFKLCENIISFRVNGKIMCFVLFFRCNRTRPNGSSLALNQNNLSCHLKPWPRPLHAAWHLLSPPVCPVLLKLPGVRWNPS